MASSLFFVTDDEIREMVQYRLEMDPDVCGSEVTVAVADGVVSLAGSVRTYSEKLSAERVAGRVQACRVVANNIRVAPNQALADVEIARTAVRALRAQTALTEEISVISDNGVLTLNGVVDRPFQRRAAEAAVTYLYGVRGVTNQILVRPSQPQEG